jgi:hypothetical protein
MPFSIRASCRFPVQLRRHVQRWTIPGPRNHVKPLLYWMAVIHELNQLP